MAARGATARWQRLLANPRARRAAWFAGKAAAGATAAGAGLALGLREVKRSLDAREAVDFWREVSFDLRRGRAAAAGAAAREAPGAALARLATQGGFSREDFEAAAMRLRPVELELEELLEVSAASGGDASRAAREAALVATWRAAGHFEPAVRTGRTRADLFGRRLTSDAQGVDVGVLVPPYLVPGDASSGAADAGAGVRVQPGAWEGRAAEREEAVCALRRWGCVRLGGAVAPPDVAALRVALGLADPRGGPRKAAELGQWLLQRDPNVAMGRYTFGRLHCILRGSADFEPHAVAAHAAVAPLVHAFFRDDEAAGQRVFLSEAQLVVADPCAEAQFWHLEKAGGADSRGLTVFVPLSDVTADRGPQAVLPGTHCLSDASLSYRERLRGCLWALCAAHGAVPAAAAPDRVWAAGDALVMDAGLLHRGLPNDSLGAPVAVLVLRYDLASCPPPGCSRRWLLLMTQVGRALEAVFALYAAV